MAEMRVSIEGMSPEGSSLPVSISGTLPPGSAIPVALAAPDASSAPVPSSVLSASATADQTLFSMTGGQIWYGFFTLSGSLTSTSKAATVLIENLGGSATPAAGTAILSLNLATGALTDATEGSTHTDYMYIYAGGSDNDVHATVTGDPATLSATAYGYLLS